MKKTKAQLIWNYAYEKVKNQQGGGMVNTFEVIIELKKLTDKEIKQAMAGKKPELQTLNFWIDNR